ncbi:MAG: ice-binding family protein [Methanoregula sp.]|jgi:hypothetical protein|uniref:ice-binding family protein n=1 Tax=Methanoregula sp. TaxID=2052170 RepID=UPI003D1416ED
MKVNMKEYPPGGTKKSAGKLFSIVVTVALVCLMTVAIIPGVNGASAVYLGSAGNYAILAESGITTTGTTMIIGNIGVSPIASTAIAGFGLTLDPSRQYSKSSLVTGDVYAADYSFPTPALLTTAVSDMETAYTDAAGRTPDVTELGDGYIGGMTIAPGVYKWRTNVRIPTAITLSGGPDDVWIFEIAQNLDISENQPVILTGGAQAQNIYWVVAGQTTLARYSTFNGNILDQTAIVLNTGARLNGRALAQTAVTLDANTITALPSITAETAATTPGENAATTAPTGTAGTTITVNVVGDSGVYRAELTGTGHNGLIVTGIVASGPGKGISQPPGTVYQYLDLLPAQYTSIDQAVLSFIVPLSWLDGNNITPQNVILYHLDGHSWMALPTTLVKTDGGEAYFTAVSPGFYQFAIAGQFTSPVTTVETAIPPSQSPPIVSPVTPAQPTPLPTTKSPVPVWVPVIAAISALLIMALLSGRRGKKS